jgi:transketolase
MLYKDGIDAEVVHCPTIKPLDSETILRSARKTRAVVTCEEAQINGGLGGAVAELLSEALPVPLRRIGIRDHFGESGVKNQLKVAQEHKVPIALIMGQKEAMDEMVILRDVKSGMQEIISYDKIVEEVKKRLGK